MNTRQKREDREEPKAKPAKAQPMVEMTMGLDMHFKESAIANDFSMFKRLLNERVIIKKTGDVATTYVGTLKVNGNMFVELEDVASVCTHGFRRALEQIRKIENGPPAMQHHLECTDSMVLNKSEIGRMASVDSLKTKEGA